MTHRVESPDEYNDPRDALKFEAERIPELKKKQKESNVFASVVRASRVAEGMDTLIRRALEVKRP